MTQIYTFEEWMQDQLNNTPASALVLCPECNGETVITDECSRCGHETEENCHLCDDHDGQVLWSDLNDVQKKKTLSPQRYNDALINDLTALANWQSRNKIEVLVDYGFTVYTLISNKLEKITKSNDPGLPYVNRMIQHG